MKKIRIPAFNWQARNDVIHGLANLGVSVRCIEFKPNTHQDMLPIIEFSIPDDWIFEEKEEILKVNNNSECPFNAGDIVINDRKTILVEVLKRKSNDNETFAGKVIKVLKKGDGYFLTDELTNWSVNRFELYDSKNITESDTRGESVGEVKNG